MPRVLRGRISRASFRLALASGSFTAILLLVLFQSVRPTRAYNNGLAPTPPMGWNSWNNFGCNVSDALIRQMADAMVSSGMAAAGYQYVNIDDCWMDSTRTNGHQTATSAFPDNGIRGVADYVHSKGLKLGLYSDYGTLTCQGRAGSFGYESTDANDYASWGVDYLKYDHCNVPNPDYQQQNYERMRDALANSGRDIVFSICAVAYKAWMPDTGNLWRTTEDITDDWASIMSIADLNNQYAQAAGPNAWNDPDMLEVGRGGMTAVEDRTHMSLWAIMAAPLLAGNDLRSMSSETREILTNPEVIAVDQDPLGRQGTKVWESGSGLEVWSKVLQGVNVRAVALVNRGGMPANIAVNWSRLGIPEGPAAVRDLWSRADLGDYASSYIAHDIPPHGTVLLRIDRGAGLFASFFPSIDR